MLKQIALVLGLVVLTFAAMFIVARIRNGGRRKMERPPESGNAWSNNAIRKLGDKGKGIR